MLTIYHIKSNRIALIPLKAMHNDFFGIYVRLQSASLYVIKYAQTIPIFYPHYNHESIRGAHYFHRGLCGNLETSLNFSAIKHC